MLEYIFISGPYSNGGNSLTIKENVKIAIDTANRLVDLGYVPIIPHLFHFWDELHPHDWDYWMEICLKYVAKVDAVLRLPGESKGADVEVKYAKQKGIFIVDSIEQLVKYG